MAIEVRGITEEEYPAWIKAMANGFGSQETDEEVEEMRAETEVERAIASFDKGKVVGTTGAFSFELTLPGRRAIPFAAVTGVTVRTTHRRRGVLTSMMRHQLGDVKERGEALAGLYASESVIYGRFGYGPATYGAPFEIETRWGEFARPVAMDGLDIIDAESAAKILPEAYERFRREVPGDVTRTKFWWDNLFKDKEKSRDGASARFYAVHETKGEVDGFATWRVKGDWANWLPGNSVLVHDVVALNSRAEHALWRLLLDVDLARKVTGWAQIDHPLRGLLADPRRIQVKAVVDQEWLRLIDVPKALVARAYEGSDHLVIEVRDDFTGFAAGRFALDASPEGSTCKSAKKKADLTLGVQELSAAYLGGGGLVAFARAGRVDEHTSGAVARAERLFRTGPMPFCRTGY